MTQEANVSFVVSDVVAAISKEVLDVRKSAHTVELKATITDPTSQYDEVYLVQGGRIKAVDSFDLPVAEADLSIRPNKALKKYERALNGDNDSSAERFNLTVHGPVNAVKITWEPLVATVKDGKTTYHYAEPTTIYNGATVLNQVGIDKVQVVGDDVVFSFAADVQDELLVGEKFSITLVTGTYTGLVHQTEAIPGGKDKPAVPAQMQLIVTNETLRSTIMASAAGGAISFTHLLEILGNYTFTFELANGSTTVAGYTLHTERPTLTSTGDDLAPISKGKMEGVAKSFAQEGFGNVLITPGDKNNPATETELSSLVALEALLVEGVKTVRIAYDSHAYHQGGGVLNLLWGPKLESSQQFTLKLDGSAVHASVNNDALYDHILASVGVKTNMRIYVTQPAPLPVHWTLVRTSGVTPVPPIAQEDGDNIHLSVNMVVHEISTPRPGGGDPIITYETVDEGLAVRMTNPDLNTISTERQNEVVLSKLGVVLGSGQDADKVVWDGEGISVGDVSTITPGLTSLDKEAAGINPPTEPLSGIKRRNGFVYSPVNADWARYLERMAEGTSMGALMQYRLQSVPRTEYTGEYTVTIGDDGVWYGWKDDSNGDPIFGDINKRTTPLSYMYRDVSGGAQGPVGGKLMGVASNNTEFHLILSHGSVKAVGKTVKFIRSDDDSARYDGTVGINEAGDIVATFGYELAVSLASEYGDGDAFSFDLEFSGDDGLGTYIIKSTGHNTASVENTFATGGADLITGAATDPTEKTTTLFLRNQDETAHAVYETKFYNQGVETKLTGIVGLGDKKVTYPDASLYNTITKALYTGFDLRSLPLGNNAIKVGRKPEDNGSTTFGYTETMGGLCYVGLVIDGKFDAKAKVLAITVNATTEGVLTSEMLVHTAGLEAVGKTITLTTDGGVATGVLEEVDGESFLRATITGTEWATSITTVPEDQWHPLSIEFSGDPSLTVPSVLLVGGGSKTLPFSRVEGEATGSLLIEDTLPQNTLDNLRSIRVDGETVTMATLWTEGSILEFKDFDIISSTDEPLTVTATVDGIGRATFTDARFAGFMADSYENAVTFNFKLTPSIIDAPYQVTLATDPETGAKGYMAGKLGSVNSNVITGAEDKFNVNRSVVMSDIYALSDDVLLRINETAIQQVGRTVTLETTYATYTATVTNVNGQLEARFGKAAFDEIMTYPDAFIFGFDLTIAGDGTEFIGESVMRMVADEDGIYTAIAQEAPITSPGYIVNAQVKSDVVAVKEVVARNDGKSVRLILS